MTGLNGDRGDIRVLLAAAAAVLLLPVLLLAAVTGLVSQQADACASQPQASAQALTIPARYAAGGTQVLAAEQSPACQQANLGPLTAGTAGKVIAYAEAQLGKPYQWGATGPDAFDCSGLAMMAYRAAGISIPRTSQQQWASGRQVPASQVQPGDLVFFAGSDGTMAAPGHVGIVTGHDTMIDAPFTGEVVREESFRGTTDLVGFTRP